MNGAAVRDKVNDTRVSLGFHHCPIHAIEFRDEDFNQDLVFDIDHMQASMSRKDDHRFQLQPALLMFHEVTDLCIRMDKKGLSLNGYLNTIVRLDSRSSPDGLSRYRMRVLNGGCIDFIASGYSLSHYGRAQVKEAPFLSVSERTRP